MNEQPRTRDIASSSNSSLLSSKKYDVFLSFRGKDTRDNFTSHLYDALTRDKIETFIDNWLEKGDEISPALIKAIENSHISVIIFSENYASSKWCLNELNKIMEFKKEKGQIVIPVFYKVDPFHVRHQTGSYKEAFAKHEGHSMCSKWKAALTEAANLSGWHSQNRTESELLKGIVRDVLKKLAPTYPIQSKRLVGIEKSFEEIESFLRIGSSEVITLGIWGMGGIGKTTLATALYDKLSYDFEGRCFLANVREKSDKLEDLRHELFSTLLGENKCQFDGFDMSRLRCKSLFIVLDDVSTQEQLEKLIEEYDFMGAESRVIVTTRDKHILSTNHNIYQLDKLNSDHSVELFCFTVFGEKKPKQGYEDLSRRVISYCEGVPLALKVLGAIFRERNKEAWECELRKLHKFPNMKIHNVLKLSYDGLDRPQKDLFLDIACFFKGEERDWVTGLLEAFDFFPTSGIEVLLDKALITISNANQIEMHDLIQEMGREIVHQESEKYPGKRSRLWKHEEVLDVLKYNKGTDDVEGIILDLDKLKGDLYLSSDFLAKMANLRFLKIHKKCRWHDRYNVYLRDGLESLSDKLGYLHWDRCSLKSWPPNFCAEQLVELRMSFTDVKKLWDGVQNLLKLKSIDLSFSNKLMEIPDLSKAEKLEKLSLACCYSLRQLHPSTLSLPELAYLNLKYCRNIENLESNVHSKSLNELTLSHCLSLEKFSVTSYEIKVLNLSNTAICALSPSICDLLSLEVLDLSRSKVKSLPENIKNLSKLTWLQLEGCEKLVSLPELPSSLRKLYLNDCWELKSLSKLPPYLRELPLDNCKKLMSLPELPPTVKKVTAYNCISLKTNITQGLVLKHTLQYLKNSEFCGLDYFIFPGDHVNKGCGFHATESLLTISYIPKSDLFGFIYCIIFLGKDSCWHNDGSIYIYQNGIELGRENIPMRCFGNLDSAHMFFSYVDISRLDRISDVDDQFGNITFKFKLEVHKDSIKGCGVFPVYATTSGLKLVSNCSSNKVGHDQTRIKGSEDNESQARAITVGCSGIENEDDWEQLLPASKRQRTSP